MKQLIEAISKIEEHKKALQEEYDEAAKHFYAIEYEYEERKDLFNNKIEKLIKENKEEIDLRWTDVNLFERYYFIIDNKPIYVAKNRDEYHNLSLSKNDKNYNLFATIGSFKLNDYLKLKILNSEGLNELQIKEYMIKEMEKNEL